MNVEDIARKRQEQINRLQDKKHEARAKATDLWNITKQLKQDATSQAELRQITSNHAFDLFVTPPQLARRMVEMASSIDDVLEPNAGTGAIMQAVKEAGGQVEGVELNWSLVDRLVKQGYTVTQGNFLETTPRRYKAAIMNPPFSNGADIDHVLHAAKFCDEVIAIMSEGVFYRSDKKAVMFREWLESNGGISEQLPQGTFAKSGTQVNTRLVRVIGISTNP